MTYGGVSTEICWTIIKGRRFYRCPKCHHRLHLSLVDDDLHCHNCGHVEHVERCDPEELE
jgi:DNA-directed RNA polymerase subunit RPC12/RpoP